MACIVVGVLLLSVLSLINGSLIVNPKVGRKLDGELTLYRFARDVVDTARSVYETVAKGTKAVVNDLLGNNHVAVESYRQAGDARQRVVPAFKDIFVSSNKSPQPVGPPPRPTQPWEAELP